LHSFARLFDWRNRSAKNLGQGKRVVELTLSFNCAEEATIPKGKTLLANAVKYMSGLDAKNILNASNASVTAFFYQQNACAPVGITFLPIVTKATEKVGALNKYNEFASKAAGFVLVEKEDASVQQYGTGKSIGSIHLVMGEEEKKFRQDPVGTESAILKKVLEAIK
jgi:hypothetical protein